VHTSPIKYHHALIAQANAKKLLSLFYNKEFFGLGGNATKLFRVNYPSLNSQHIDWPILVT